MSAAAQEALAKGSAPVDVSKLPAAATQAPFERADKWLGGASAEESIVARDRCVWVVTVEAEFQARSAPRGKVPPRFDVYTTMFDALSGQYLGVSAGSDAANLVTGDGLSR